MQLLARLVGKVVYGSCLGREADAYLVYLALVGGVRKGIAFFLYLLQCYFSSRVEFELEDIYIIGTLEYAVNAPLARLLLNICVISAKQAHKIAVLSTYTNPSSRICSKLCIPIGYFIVVLFNFSAKILILFNILQCKDTTFF